MAKMVFQLPRRCACIDNPSPEELQAARRADAERAARRRYGNLNVQTEVLARSKRSTFIVTDDPDGQRTRRSRRERGQRVGGAPGRLHRRQEMVVVDGYIGNDPEFRVAGAPLHRGGEREHRRHAAAALLPGRGRDGLRARADRHLHAQPEGARATRTTGSSPSTSSRASRASSTPTTSASRRRAACGCGTSSSTTAAGCRSTRAARSSRPTRGDRVGLIVGLSGTGKTTTTFTRQNGSLPGAGRLRRVDAGRQGLRDRERLLREDVRPQPGGRADDLRRRHAARLRTSRTSRRRATRSTSSTRATRRTGARPSRSA